MNIYVKLIFFLTLTVSSSNSFAQENSGVKTSQIESTKDEAVYTPDDIITLSDTILRKSLVDYEVFKSNFEIILETYRRNDIGYYDKVFVYLMKHFVYEGATPWMAGAEKKFLIERAIKLEKLLPGATPPKLLMMGKSGSSTFFNEHVKEDQFTVLLFWDVECSNCIETAELIEGVRKNLKDSIDIEVFTLNSGINKDFWTNRIKERGLTHWNNYIDPTDNNDGFRNYQIEGTPTFFVIGPDKKIWAKSFFIEDDTILYNIFRSKSAEECMQNMALENDWRLNELNATLDEYLKSLKNSNNGVE